MNNITFPLIQNRTTVWLLLSVVLAATIAALRLMPQASMPVGPQGVDKVYHMVAFAALIFPTALLRPRWCLRFGCLAILYGGIIEARPCMFRAGRSLPFALPPRKVASSLLESIVHALGGNNAGNLRAFRARRS
jgi:hypothetical protein